jgi:hypothetical protein
LVVASQSTMGVLVLDRTPDIEQSESPMLVDVAMCEFAIDKVGTSIMTTEPGEKPSFWFSYFGLMCTPCTFSGVAVAEMLTRSPVGVLAGLVKALFGHGNRQSWPTGVETNASHWATPGFGIRVAADAGLCVPAVSNNSDDMVATAIDNVINRWCATKTPPRVPGRC